MAWNGFDFRLHVVHGGAAQGFPAEVAPAVVKSFSPTPVYVYCREPLRKYAGKSTNDFTAAGYAEGAAGNVRLLSVAVPTWKKAPAGGCTPGR
jgi:hypothetical protein